MNNLPKFRAWNLKEKTMHEVFGWQKYGAMTNEELICCGPESDGKYIYRPLKEFILMQSTGLRDKNGVEIFLGDVILWNPTDHQSWIGEVKLDNECGPCKGLNCFQYIIGNTCNLWDEKDLKNMQVKGNIYEHPNLIKELEESEWERTKDHPANQIFKDMAKHWTDAFNKGFHETFNEILNETLKEQHPELLGESK